MVVVIIALIGLIAAPITASAGVVHEYAIPAAGGQPFAITLGPDGALWFKEAVANQIGRLNRKGQFTMFPVPDAGQGNHGIAAGPDGAVWFTERFRNKIGRLTTTGSYSEFAVSNSPAEIAPGPDGAMWFTEPSVNPNRIGRITVDGTVTEFPIPTQATPLFQLDGITAGPDGALWFCRDEAGKIGRLTTDGAYSEYPVPTPGGDDEIVTGPDGALVHRYALADAAGFPQIAWDIRLPQLAKNDAPGPFVIPGTYEATLQTQNAGCGGTRSSRFAVAIAGQTPQMLAAYRASFPQRVLAYRVEHKTNRVVATVTAFLEYARYLRQNQSLTANKQMIPHTKALHAQLDPMERLFADATYGTGESFFPFQTVSAIVGNDREDLDNVRGYSGSFTSMAPVPRAQLQQIVPIVDQGESTLREMLAKERAFLAGLPPPQREKASKQFQKVEKAFE